MPRTSLLVIIILMLSVSLAGAEMYQWVDDNGVVSFKDTPPPAAKKNKKVKVYNDSDFAPAPPVPAPPAPRDSKKIAAAASQPAPPQQHRFTGTVELYVTDWCGYCKRAISYLKSNNIPYVAYDIEKDSAANQRHKQLGGNGVPLIIVGSHKMSGYSQRTLEYYLNNSQ